MTDIIGPSSSAPNVVTVRPADGRVFNALDTWFQACSAPGANDGTTISDAFLNGVLGILRTATRGMGIADATSADNLLRDAIRAAKLRFAVAGGTADALTAAFSPPLVSYSEAAFFVVPSAANTGAAMTLAVDGMAAKSVQYQGGDPPAGLFQVGIAQMLMYDGTNLQVIGRSGIKPGLPKLSFLQTTQTWTRAVGATKAFVIAHGPGGAGSADPRGASSSGGCGGGAGGCAMSLLDISAIASAAVTVSVGGAGVTDGAGGAGGGNTSFGALVVAGPGQGGGLATNNGISGGAPGIGTTGEILVRGNPGDRGLVTTGDPGGNGGAGLFGGAGRGGSDDYSISATAGILGGGGGSPDSAETANAGLAGGDGWVLILEF